MSEFAPGTERDFVAVVPITETTPDAAVKIASAAAQLLQDAWGQGCPASAKVCAFSWRSGYELFERPGEGWLVRFIQSIRVYSLEESTTLPGDWGNEMDRVD